MKILLSLFCGTVLSGFTQDLSAAPDTAKQWQVYDGYQAEGYGRHIVLISGDEEYRSEEALSQLGKILALRQGFKCTVLYAQDPEKPGIINPQVLTHIPGLEALRTADCMIIATRFRDLPVDQMEEIDAYLKSGRPVIGLRTANHGFRPGKDSKWRRYGWKFNDPNEPGWEEGFGGAILGSWFFSHHGWHGKESTRGIVEAANKNHRILTGIKKDSVWGATDVYGVKEPIPGKDIEIILRGQVLKNMEMDSAPAGPEAENRKGLKNRNNPMQALAWTKSYQIPGGRKGRAFCTTLGSSLDFEAEGTRKLVVNAVFWSLEEKVLDPDVRIVDTFEPSAFKTHPKKYWEERQLKVSDFDLKSELHTRTSDKAVTEYDSSSGGREGFGYEYADHPVNRDRIYNYYRRQAAHFLSERNAGKDVPALIPNYPALDGAENGHWGKYGKNSYRDRRWQIMEHGEVFSGIFRAGKQTLPKAIAVNLGNNVHCAFDPDSGKYTHVWEGEFIEFSANRWGIGGGIQPGGKIIATNIDAKIPEGARYRGHIRRGNRVAFMFEKDGKKFYSIPAFQNGVLKVDSDLASLPKSTARYADKAITLSGSIGTAIPGAPFAIDRIPVPLHNEFGSVMLIGGHDFFSNGDAAVCTMAGDVWRVTGLDKNLKKVKWKRIATGLNQALGLSIFEDKIYVVGRDRINRLHDQNGDGEIDFYENFCDDYDSMVGGHDFYTGLQRGDDGYFYFVGANIGVMKVSPDGKSAESLATGLRNANGIGTGPDGLVTTSTNEGDWTPASAVFEVRNGDFYGRRARKGGPEINPAMAYIPRGVDNSSGGQIYVTSKKWGPLQDQLLHFSFGNGTWMMILRDVDKAGGRTQGAVVPLPGDFQSGSHRGRFNPADGQLYVTGSDGWGNYAITDGSFARVRYLPKIENPYPTGWKAHSNGISVRFDIPIDPDSVKTDNFFCQTWNYLYGEHYGSLEFSTQTPGIPGHDLVKIKSVELHKDGKGVFLQIPELKPAMQFHIYGELKSAKSGNDIQLNMFPTLLRLDSDFTEFAGYSAKAATAGKVTKLTLPVKFPVPFKPKVADGKTGRKIMIQAVIGLQFKPKQIRVKAGEQISLEFKNTDSIPHNLVLIQRDSLMKVGEATNKMMADPKAADMHYAPNMVEVLHYTPMLDHNQRKTLNITAPKEPGVYPFICTFPGHWMVMKGEMIVE